MRRHAGFSRLFFGLRRRFPCAVMRCSTGVRKSVLGLAAFLMSICLFFPKSARAQYDYVMRNDNEVYPSFVLLDNMSYWNPAENRLWRSIYARRYLKLLRNEAKMNRRFYLDFGSEVIWPDGMPGWPYQAIDSDYIAEAAFLDAETGEIDGRDATVRVKAFGHGRVWEDWDLGIELDTRFHLVQDLIDAEFQARAVLGRKGVSEGIPYEAGFFLGPTFRPMNVLIGGFTFGGYAHVSFDKRSLSQVILSHTSWSDSDIFENVTSLRLRQFYSLLSRRLGIGLSAGLDYRPIHSARYQASFGEDPPEAVYIDMWMEASTLVHLPLAFELGVSGRYLPIHTPDPNIVRWYRPVWPEVGLALERKIAIFDFSLGYNLGWVPPADTGGEDYPDSGRGLIEGSTLGWTLTLTLDLKI